MKINEKFQPLFDLISIKPIVNNKVDYSNIKDYSSKNEYYDKLSMVDTVVMTSGRYGGKSITASIAVNEATIQYDSKTLYTRYTNKSLKDSVRAEFIENINLLGYTQYYKITEDRAISFFNESSQVVFKGIKPSSGNQTANLKSLKGFNILVIDEAEEVPDYKTFRKIYYSIRSLDKRNISILICNQTDNENWIQKEYFEKRNVDHYYNGVKGNVLYINTNYLDLEEDMIPQNILNEYNRLKLEDPEEYENTILGAWIENREGTLFKKSEIKQFKLKDLNREVIDAKVSYIDVASGGLDYTCMVYAELIGGNVYVTDVVMSKGDSNYTIPTCRNLLLRTKANYCQVETNNAGKIFFNELEKGVRETSMLQLYNSTNKETRITNSAFFVKKKIYFRSDYEVGSEYHEFMKQILSFNIDKKLNKHDDAPDALAGLVAFIHKYYAYYFDVS